MTKEAKNRKNCRSLDTQAYVTVHNLIQDYTGLHSHTQPKNQPEQTLEGLYGAQKTRWDWSDKNDIINGGVQIMEKKVRKQRETMETDKYLTVEGPEGRWDGVRVYIEGNACSG